MALGFKGLNRKKGEKVDPILWDYNEQTKYLPLWTQNPYTYSIYAPISPGAGAPRIYGTIRLIDGIKTKGKSHVIITGNIVLQPAYDIAHCNIYLKDANTDATIATLFTKTFTNYSTSDFNPRTYSVNVDFDISNIANEKVYIRIDLDTATGIDYSAASATSKLTHIEIS